jgi:hypothetical protein
LPLLAACTEHPLWRGVLCVILLASIVFLFVYFSVWQIRLVEVVSKSRRRRKEKGRKAAGALQLAVRYVYIPFPAHECFAKYTHTKKKLQYYKKKKREISNTNTSVTNIQIYTYCTDCTRRICLPPSDVLLCCCFGLCGS